MSLSEMRHGLFGFAVMSVYQANRFCLKKTVKYTNATKCSIMLSVKVMPLVFVCHNGPTPGLSSVWQVFVCDEALFSDWISAIPFFHNVAFKDTTTLGRAQHELCLGLRTCSFYTTYIKNGFLFEIVLSLRYILLHVKHFHIINEHGYIHCLLV